MNKKGITLIALIITVIVLLILAIVSIVSMTEGDIINRTEQVKEEEQIAQFKETIKAVTNQVLQTASFSTANELAFKIEEELNKIEGFETVAVEYGYGDYAVYGLINTGITFEEATGKKLELYVDTYVKRTEIEGR